MSCDFWHHSPKKHGPRSESLRFGMPKALYLSRISPYTVYDNPKFLEAAGKRWANKTIIILPLIVGTRGIWPRSNDQVADELKIIAKLK